MSPSNNFFFKTISKITSSLGFGMIGLLYFSHEKSYPSLFYLFSVAFGFFLYFVSLNLINRMSSKAKINSIVGISAISGPFLTYSTVFSVFSALVIFSGISFKYSIELGHDSLKISSIPKNLIFFVVCIIFYLSIRYFPHRCKLYFWSKLVTGLSLIIISIIKIYINFNLIINLTHLEMNFDILKEFITIQVIVLNALFCQKICDENILQVSGRKIEESPSIDLFSSIVSFCSCFLIYCLIILSNFTPVDGKIDYVITILWILISFSSFVHSFEYFDCANNFIYGFFKPLIQESILSLNSKNAREIWLTFVIISIGYFVKNFQEIFSAISN